MEMRNLTKNKKLHIYACMNECICVCTTSFTLFHMLSKTSTPSCTFFKTLSISPCNFLGAPIISKMSSVIGWVQQDKNPGVLTHSRIRSARIHSYSGQTWLMMISFCFLLYMYDPRIHPI
jgi:hypothetical protein